MAPDKHKHITSILHTGASCFNPAAHLQMHLHTNKNLSLHKPPTVPSDSQATRSFRSQKPDSPRPAEGSTESGLF